MRQHQTSLLIAYLLISCSAAVLAIQEDCSSSCGHLSINYPFRLKEDRPSCGNRSYELTCHGGKAIMDLYAGKYYVESISYLNRTVQITDVGLAAGGCALPSKILSLDYMTPFDAFYPDSESVASFINCTQEIQNKTYTPVPCLSGKSGFVYVVLEDTVLYLQPSCRFLSMVPSIYDGSTVSTEARVFELLQEGFVLHWGGNSGCSSASYFINYCAVETRKELKNDLKHKILFYRVMSPLAFQKNFFNCLDSYNDGPPELEPNCPSKDAIFRLVKVLNVLLDAVAFILLGGLIFRFLLAPLSVFAFLAYTFQQMPVPINAVEKFIRNQQRLTPTRYTYTDIIAMTRNFKVKLGQGGFGSVYKGIMPDGYQVAVKMLGNSKCNGDDFISEVSTIGRIHHVNVVRLVGYSSEGSKRALVYECLPRGSLDKYIFSSTYLPNALSPGTS